MIIVQHIQSLPCLRMLFCVNKGLSFFCKQRFITLNREMEAKISEDVQYMLKSDTTTEHGMENTFVWQLLQVVRMREKVLRANRKVRLDVNSIFEAARISRVELQQKIESSNQRVQALQDELASRKRGVPRNHRAVDLLREAKLVADQFKDDTANLSRENSRAMRAMGARLRALLRKSSRCLKRNIREIDRVTRKCWSLAAILGSDSWIADLRAAVRRLDAALADRLRMGARAPSRFELVHEPAGCCQVAVRFVREERD